jgi:hypothetical protein
LAEVSENQIKTDGKKGEDPDHDQDVNVIIIGNDQRQGQKYQNYNSIENE